MLKLVLPRIELEQDCKEYILEHYNNGETKISGDGGMGKYKIFSEWVENREKCRNNIDIPDYLVPDTTFLVYDDTRLVGLIDIRHYLNENLLKLGGHIGYSIRPSERRKGYGKRMLKLALDYCKTSLNLDKVLLSCDKNNLASKKVILANRGILESETYSEQLNRYTEKYWIHI